MTRSALVLAGSRGGEDPVARYAGVSDKALAVLDGSTLLARVTVSLREAGFDHVLVSANSAPVVAETLRLRARPMLASAGPSASTAAALSLAGAPLLVTTADHALLRPEWIEHFLSAIPVGADVGILLARREDIERTAAGTRRTYLKFADGHWSGCNLFYLATTRAEAAISLWQEVEQDRKRPWRIVRRLGPLLLLRYLARRLTLADAIAHLGRRAGLTVAVVAAQDGLAAVDVDKPDDLDFVRSRTAQSRAR